MSVCTYLAIVITLSGFHCFNVWEEQIKLNFCVKYIVRFTKLIAIFTNYECFIEADFGGIFESRVN